MLFDSGVLMSDMHGSSSCVTLVCMVISQYWMSGLCNVLLHAYCLVSCVLMSGSGMIIGDVYPNLCDVSQGFVIFVVFMLCVCDVDLVPFGENFVQIVVDGATSTQK